MKRILARDIYHIIKSVEGKKTIVYGTGKHAADVIEKMKCLGIETAYCVDDDFSDVVVKQRVCDIYSLLLEKEPCYVFIVKNDLQKAAQILNGLGLKYYEDYGSFYLAAGKLMLEKTFALDPMLGYSLPYQETQGRGVKIYGDIYEAECTIAILGGSTSDPCAYRWKCWGELLYEKGCKRGEKIAVIVGAVCGYSSSEELMKLIRDLLPLKPDIVISYSGVNDRRTNQPYINGYQRLLYGKLAMQQEQGMYGLGDADSVCCGVTEELPPSQKWKRNQKMMHLLTEGAGIEHIVFLQPTLISKRRGAKDEEVYFYVEESEVAEKEQYYKEIRQMLNREGLGYVVDASGWFDDADGIFYDYCHVYEEGNQMIADKIYQYIFGGD